MKLNRDFVKKELAERDMTAKELAKEIGVKDYTICKYLKGYNCPRSRAQNIADYFGVDILDIVQLKGLHY